MRVRLDKRQHLIERGEEPYPVVVERTHTLKQVVEAYDPEALGPDTQTGDTVTIAGRVIFVRGTGKLVFVVLREGDGTSLQAMISLGGVGEERLADFKSTVDIGDHLAVTGEVITSKRGELSVMATAWQLAAKTVRPLPNEHNPLSDEARSRMRYVDLIVRPEARDNVRVKAKVMQSLRSTLDRLGYVEVETPVLQHTNGGAAARPFRTHVNAFDEPALLRIALELHLKRALVGGIDKVYEMAKTFRNEGVDNTHNVEFLMLEAYEAYGSYDTMAVLTRELVIDAARSVGKTVVTGRDGSTIDLESEWRHATVHDLVSEAVGRTVDTDTPVEELVALAAKHEVALQDGWDAGEIVLELYEKLVEHTLIQPTFVRDYPESVRPLAKKHRTKPGLVEAWDLIINGVELAPAYSELNDPVIQRERLEEQARQAAAGNPEANDVDEDFLRALEFGMPPAGGLGFGVDRLVMLLQGIGIRDAILFPTTKSEGTERHRPTTKSEGTEKHRPTTKSE
ncbi:lysine--tRNA ligase [Aeromicrobium chenweiae]|uniref:Lysine--tRNA ligase n=1 Tax=Aeromicrobium chenweiae TaxID=2079793 RepID=A0A2S0WSF3_9ACTN|nr:lysine--tRNA ligase [Aeromicrobium chenweiae]AWB94218.1 lysine--tRNA ligase [Aeromicrobium chenweiae]TGN33296.1 lysine--tRNA ligase [Aeromicrobium chenweiae]